MTTTKRKPGRPRKQANETPVEEQATSDTTDPTVPAMAVMYRHLATAHRLTDKEIRIAMGVYVPSTDPETRALLDAQWAAIKEAAGF